MFGRKKIKKLEERIAALENRQRLDERNMENRLESAEEKIVVCIPREPDPYNFISPYRRVSVNRLVSLLLDYFNLRYVEHPAEEKLEPKGKKTQ